MADVNLAQSQTAPQSGGDVQGLVADPEFQRLPPSQQRIALVRISGDPAFASLSDSDTLQAVNRLMPRKTTTGWGDNEPILNDVTTAIKNVPGGIAREAWRGANRAFDLISGQAGGPNAAVQNGQVKTPLGQKLGIEEGFKDPTTPAGAGQALGSTIEKTGEFFGAEALSAGSAASRGLEKLHDFILGDNSLADLTLGDKVSNAGRVLKSIEFSPKLQQALKIGMNALRSGTEIGAQDYLHGASGEESIATGATAAGLATVLGGIAGGWDMFRQARGFAKENAYIKTPVDLLIRAVNPPEEVALSGAGPLAESAQRSYAKFDKELKANLPYIMGTAQETGVIPAGRRAFIDTTMKTADKAYNLYNRDILTPMQDVEVSANRRIPSYGGAYSNKDEGMATLRQLDTRLNDLNDILFPKYEAGKGGLVSEAKVGAAVDLTKEASAIRKVLYGDLQHGVGDRLGVNVAEIKARNGQLRDLADAMERRWQQARAKEFTPLGDIAPTPYRAAEAGMVRGKRALVGDPRDSDIRDAWEFIRQRGDHGIAMSVPGPSVPPPTNAFVEKNHKIGKAADITWEGSSPAEISARKAAKADEEAKKALAANASGLAKAPPAGQELRGLPVVTPPQAGALASAPIKAAPDTSGLARTVSTSPQASELQYRPLPASEPAAMKKFERSTPSALGDRARAEAEVRRKAAAKEAKAKKLTGE